MKPKLFHRNFSLLIAGQASSLLGNGILDFAMSMYVWIRPDRRRYTQAFSQLL